MKGVAFAQRDGWACALCNNVEKAAARIDHDLEGVPHPLQLQVLDLYW